MTSTTPEACARDSDQFRQHLRLGNILIRSGRVLYQQTVRQSSTADTAAKDLQHQAGTSGLPLSYRKRMLTKRSGGEGS